LSNKERKRIPRDKTSRHFQILEAQASQASRIITTGGEGPEKKEPGPGSRSVVAQPDQVQMGEKDI
jgi:hypothetical protein